jgi:DNA polymerase-3 subunit delta'
MSWSSIVGHEEPIRRLRAALESGRLHPALLFEGPEGIGKRRVALTLARAVHCPRSPERGGDPCGECRTCLTITASADPAKTTDNQSEHPGVRVVTPSRPDERELRFGGSAARGEVRSQITVPQIRVILTEGIMRGLATGPRFVIIDPADRMGEAAANALLKTLEEPPASERFILITSKPSALLPTIRSRCVRFRFHLLAPGEVRRVLESAVGGGPDVATAPATGAGKGGGASRPTRRRNDREFDLIASLAEGRIGRALELAEGPALAAFRETRALLLDSLESLAHGLPAGTFAVVTGASFRAREREEWLEAIGVLERLLRDLAVLAADPGADVVNADIRDRLAPLARPLGTRAARALGLLDSVRADLRVNVNPRLAAERILVEVAR